MKLFALLISAAIAFNLVEAKHKHHHKHKKHTKTVLMTLTRTAMTRTVHQTVIKQMAAPTNYKKSGDCYCQI